MAPSTYSASIITESGDLELKKVPLPKPGENEALVKVVAAALNPTDCKSYVVICDQASFLTSHRERSETLEE